MGRYCSYILPKQTRGTAQILIFKTSRPIGRPRLYLSTHRKKAATPLLYVLENEKTLSFFPCRSLRARTCGRPQSSRWATTAGRTCWRSRDELYKNRSSRKIDSRRLSLKENRTSQRPFLLQRMDFPGRPISIQLPPDHRAVPVHLPPGRPRALSLPLQGGRHQSGGES